MTVTMIVSMIFKELIKQVHSTHPPTVVIMLKAVCNTIANSYFVQYCVRLCRQHDLLRRQHYKFIIGFFGVKTAKFLSKQTL